MTVQQQALAAEVLAAELRTCGHDDIEGIDLLDALASCGMELIQPPDPSTAEAYSDSLRRGTEGGEQHG